MLVSALMNTAGFYSGLKYLLIRLLAASRRSSTESRVDCSVQVVATQVLWALMQLSLPTHLQPSAVRAE